MSRSRIFLLCSVCLLCGVASGGIVVAWMFNEFLAVPSYSLAASASAREKVATLQLLRDGKSEKALSLLEAQLDGELVKLSVLPISSSQSDVIQRVKDYRSKFPHRSGEESVDNAVAGLLNSKPK